MTSTFSRFAIFAVFGWMASSSVTADNLGYVQAGVGTTSYDGEENATAVSVSSAMFIYNWLGVEIAFSDFGKVTNQPFRDEEIKLKANAFSLSAVGMYDINDSIMFYGKLGIDAWEADINFANNRRSDTDESTAPYFAIGLGYRFADNLGVAGEYQFHSIDVYDTNVDIEQFMLGLRLTF